MKTAGFTLIELILFIIIVGIITAGFMLSFKTIMIQTPDIQTKSRAMQLAQERLEEIIGQRTIAGFTAMTDLCSASPGLAICDVPTGYTVTSSITSSTGYKTITINVTGNGYATATTRVADY